MPPLSRRKKIIFSLIPAGLLILVAIAAEIGLRVFDVEFADDPFLNRTLKISIFREEERDGERVYRVSHPQAYGWRGLTFPIDKPEGTFRVFALGASACAGYPHPPEEDFGDYLEHALQQAYPDRKFEVLNVAAHGFASYRVRDVFDDVIEYDPDLVVLWSGNNEFLEKRTYFGTARTFVENSYLIRGLSVTLGRWLNPENSLSGWGMSRDVEIAMVFGKIEQLALGLRKDPEQYRKVLEHYEYSIGHILRTANERDVPVFALTVPSNLRDWRPNVSYHEPAAPEAAWRDAFERGERHLLDGEAEQAVEAFTAAAGLSKVHALTRYLLARAHETAGDRTAAARSYREAKDLDHNPVRTIAAINDIVRKLAAENASTRLIDTVDLYDRTTKQVAPGFDLFLDYVHPNKRGTLLIAKTIFERILAEGLVEGEPVSREFQEAPHTYEEYRDIDMARELVLLYTSMHQSETAIAQCDRALAALERGDGVLPEAGAPGAMTREEYGKFFETAKGVHETYLGEHRKRLRGEPHDAEYEANLLKSYEAFFFADWYQARDGAK